MVEWLQQWYVNQCNGDWEHEYGIRIETLDNPGWSLSIDLTGTALEGVEMEYNVKENSTTDWIGYSITKNVFKGVGGPERLFDLIRLFKEIWLKEIKD